MAFVPINNLGALGKLQVGGGKTRKGADAGDLDKQGDRARSGRERRDENHPLVGGSIANRKPSEKKGKEKKRGEKIMEPHLSKKKEPGCVRNSLAILLSSLLGMSQEETEQNGEGEERGQFKEPFKGFEFRIFYPRRASV